LLDNGNDSDVAVRENERKVLHSLFSDEHCIEVPTIYKEGDSVKVLSGTLAGHESKIVRLDKYGVIINVEMFGKSIEVKLGVELVRKLPEDQSANNKQEA
jgi:transcription antitermination factor NusG